MRFSVYCFCVLNFNESKIRKTKAVKKLCTKEKVIIRLNFNPGLALTASYQPYAVYSKLILTRARDLIEKSSTWAAVNFKKTRDLDEP